MKWLPVQEGDEGFPLPLLFYPIIPSNVVLSVLKHLVSYLYLILFYPFIDPIVFSPIFIVCYLVLSYFLPNSFPVEVVDLLFSLFFFSFSGRQTEDKPRRTRERNMTVCFSLADLGYYGPTISW